MNNNKLIVASAGSGKTTFLIQEALKQNQGKVLVTTYTQANEEEIRKRFVKINKCIPDNVTVKTWFSFLLQHGAKPYQGCKFDGNINGLILVNGQSAVGTSEDKIEKHYFTDKQKIYSDKLAKFVVKCNEKSIGAVIDRLSRIYTHIFIDEVQDLAGYDLDFLKLLFESKTSVLLVGDPRQATYSTNDSPKFKKFKKSEIVNFFEDKSIQIETDDSTLTKNFRSGLEICFLSNKLYPDLKKTSPGNFKRTGHDGIFLVKRVDVKGYLLKYRPMQLRHDIGTKVDDNYEVMTFGKSKGLEFNRVLIYPTKPFISWLLNHKSPLQPTSRSKFYVAITRAIYSVGIVFDYDDSVKIIGIKKFNPKER